MTNREFFEAIVKTESLPEEVRSHAKSQIAKLDASNAKNALQRAKKSAENAPVKEAIYNLLIAKGTMTAPDIAVELELTTSKVSAMCRQMAEVDMVEVGEVKIPKKGKLKCYTAIATA